MMLLTSLLTHSLKNDEYVLYAILYITVIRTQHLTVTTINIYSQEFLVEKGKEKNIKHKYVLNEEAIVVLRNSGQVKESRVLHGRGWVVKDRRRTIVTFS